MKYKYPNGIAGTIDAVLYDGTLERANEIAELCGDSLKGFFWGANISLVIYFKDAPTITAMVGRYFARATDGSFHVFPKAVFEDHGLILVEGGAP